MAREETRSKGSLNFHYDRGERLAMSERDREAEADKPKGLFRRNRSLAIILLDVIVIVIMFILLQFVFTPGRSYRRVGDYRVDLTAFVFEQEVYATVEVSRVRQRDADPVSGDSLVRVRFDAETDILDLLPVEVDESITVSHVYTNGAVASDAPVSVEVELLGEVIDLQSTPKE